MCRVPVPAGRRRRCHTGSLGGATLGAYMGSLMDADGINHDFTPIAGETRICLNILHEGNQARAAREQPRDFRRGARRLLRQPSSPSSSPRPIA
ncbi:MAG: hypothetical protein ACLTSX_06265 [Collinsella sp.]